MTRSSFSRVHPELDVSRTSAISTTITDTSSVLTQILTKPGSRLEQTGVEHVGVTKYQKLLDYRKTIIELVKDISDPSRLIFEINVGREPILTTLYQNFFSGSLQQSSLLQTISKYCNFGAIFFLQ